MLQTLMILGTAVLLWAWMAFIVSVAARCGDWSDYTLRREPDLAGAFWFIAIPVMLWEMWSVSLGTSFAELWKKAADATARKVCK